MNNSYMHVNMTGEWNILIFTTILLIFQLTNSQPSTSNLTRATLQEHCLTGNGSLIRLNNLNDSGSPIELLTRPMWSSVDGNDTPWIADIGCYDFNIAPRNHGQPQAPIAKYTIEGCYLECHKDYINCGKKESIYFALKESRSVCFCFCNIQELISHSIECNKSCSLDQQCRSENYYSVYTEYAIENKGSDGLCLICSNRDKIPDANLHVSDFGCDGEPLGTCVAMEDNCYEMKEDNGNLTFSNTDCEQHLPIICQKYNGNKMFSRVNPTKTSTEMITIYNKSEVTSTTLEQSSEVTLTSEILSSEEIVLSSEKIVHSSEDTSTTAVQSSELSSKYPHEVLSFIPFQHSSHSPSSVDKATALSTDTVGLIAGLLIPVFTLSSLVLFLWFYKTKNKGKCRDSQIDLQLPQTSQTVNNTYTDMIVVSGANQTQNDVTFTTTTNGVRNEDIYVEKEEGEYDHLHSSRPKQVVSEREDERYATCPQLEDVTYSTVRKSRKWVPDCDNKSDSMAGSLDNNFLSAANPDYDFCYQSRQRKD